MDGITLGVILQDQTQTLVNLLMVLSFLFLNQSASLQNLGSHFSDCDFQSYHSPKNTFLLQ